MSGMLLLHSPATADLTTVDGSSPREVLDTEGLELLTVAVSLDGTRWVGTTYQEIYTAVLEADEAPVLVMAMPDASPDTIITLGAAVLPDGRIVYGQADSNGVGHLRVVDVDGGNDESFFATEESEYARNAWPCVTDGRVWFMHTDSYFEGVWAVWSVDLDGADPQVEAELDSAAGGAPPVVSRNGASAFVSASDFPNWTTYVISGGEAEVLVVGYLVVGISPETDKLLARVMDGKFGGEEDAFVILDFNGEVLDTLDQLAGEDGTPQVGGAWLPGALFDMQGVLEASTTAGGILRASSS